MSTLISLQCQLLCACGCSYNINNSTGDYSPPAGDPFGPAIGWTAGVPVAIVGGDFDQNAALVGVVDLTIDNTATPSIVVAFQGTLPPALNIISITDWLTDFIAEPTTSGNIPGQIHSGILEGTNDILPVINTTISKLQNEESPMPIYFTGHSKGGGMTSIAAALNYFNSTPVNIPAAIYTFASPMIGNQDFVDGFPASIPVSRFENNLDMVPFLAPSSSFITTMKSQAHIFPDPTPDLDAIIFLFENVGGDGDWGYVPLGPLQFINGTSITNPGTNPCALAIAQALALGSTGITEVADAHSHLCATGNLPGGYMTGTCNNSGVCPAIPPVQ